MYIATKKVNTAFGSFKRGDLVSDILGTQYAAFEPFNGVLEKTAPVTELLVETPAEEVTVTIEKDVLEDIIEDAVEDALEDALEEVAKASKKTKKKK